MTEEWRAVTTHPEMYEVSSLGRVRVKERPAGGGCIALFVRKGKILKQTIGGRANNYKRVMLANPKRHAYVHHLIAESFIGPRPEGMLVLHTDDDGFNNTKKNIRYGDREENEMDRHVAKVAPGMEEPPF